MPSCAGRQPSIFLLSIVTDEALNFAPKGYDSPAKSIIRDVYEGKIWGFSHSCHPKAYSLKKPLLPNLILNLSSVPSGTDIATIKEETDLRPEESRRLPYLRSGDAFVSSAILAGPMLELGRQNHQSPTDNFDEFSKRRQKRMNF